MHRAVRAESALVIPKRFGAKNLPSAAREQQVPRLASLISE
jgi:hypothetical protein